MMQEPSARAALENVKAVGYGGGPLSHQIGDLLSQKLRVMNLIGSTEIAATPMYNVAQDDWEYCRYDPSMKGIEFREVENGLYEQVLVRHSSTDRYHAAWSTFPELREYRMNDLYTKHPTKPNHWLYVGRGDDVIVLSNGEKLNPTSMESTLRGHPAVKAAVVVGQARFAPAAIIELKDEVAQNLTTNAEKARFIEEEIWSFALQANRDAPAQAQLSQDRIILSSPQKPFPRAGKGTVQRAGTTALYKMEIDELYRRSDGAEQSIADLPKIDVGQEFGDLEGKIASLIGSVVSVKDLGNDTDFFTVGMDSLQVMTIVKQLKAFLIGVSTENISTRLVYSNPSVRGITAALKSMSNLNSAANCVSAATSREQRMKETLKRFIAQLPAVSVKPKQISLAREHLVVLLTGSTGSLGSYLLHTLIESKIVSKVYCLNRRADAELSQAKTNEKRGLIAQWDHRVQFLHADLSKLLLGLEESVYEKLCAEVSVVIYNQWQVDFNLALSSYEPLILGSLNLIKLSASSDRSPPIYFTSSIGTVGNWTAKHGSRPVPEISLTDPSTALAQGYSESKWVTERLLHESAEKSGVCSAVLRVGQIAGAVEVGTKGMWNRQEWLPSLMASSGYLGCVPVNLPGQDHVPWVPVDIMARAIVELVATDCVGPGSDELGRTWTKYYHLVNPCDGKWANLLPAIQAYFSSREQSAVELKLVSFGEWVSRLEQSSENKDLVVERNPALKLLEFYRSLLDAEGMEEVKLETKDTQVASLSLREMRSVDVEWMRLWLKVWEF